MKSAHTIPATVVNASNIMALSVIRSLGRARIPVNAIFGGRKHHPPYDMVVRHSRYINASYDFEESDYEENMISLLIDTGRNARHKSVLFPVSDHDMILVSKHRDRLSDYYRMLMPEHAVLDTLLHKEKFYNCALANNLPVPPTYFPAEPADIVRIAAAISYPCIIKPSWRDDRWLRLFHNTKVIHCATATELMTLCQRLWKLGYKLIIQEIVPGDEQNILCSFTYLNEHSEMLGAAVCRKIRQFPRNFGNTSLAETVADRDVADLTGSICKKLKLTGYVSIEFKKDPEGNMQILEMTPSRLNRQAGIADSAGFDIPATWYAYLTGGECSVKAHCKTGVTWVSEVNELRTIPGYLKDRRITIAELLRSYGNINRFEVLAMDDMSPFIYLMLSSLTYVCSRKGSRHPVEAPRPEEMNTGGNTKGITVC